MNICHLYHSSTKASNIKEILDAFDDNSSVDISKTDPDKDYNVYIIELGKIDKDISSLVKKIFEKKTKPPLIYFLVSKDYNLMLFQLAFMLDAKTILTSSQDVQKVVAKIKSELKIHESNYIEHLLGKTLIQAQHFMLFKEKKLFYASKKVLEDFLCKNLAEVEEKVCSRLDLNTLLSSDSIMKDSIKSDLKTHISFHARSNTLNEQNEKLVSLEPYLCKDTTENKLNFISGRLNFIEMLKDRLIEATISSKSYSIITIGVENIQKLRIDLEEEELERLFKELLLKIEVILDYKITLAQYDGNLYVALFEDISFEDLIQRAKVFHHDISQFVKDQKYVPRIGLYAFDLEGLHLNDVLNILEHIDTKHLSQEDIKNKKLQYITDIQEDMDESEAIEILLDAAYTNRVELKLLNIYKGLCINTTSKITKKKDDLIYVSIEHLQGIVMQNEGETVLQSSNFKKDIKADVKYIDLKKNTAILENFEFLNSNANARQYSRVTTSQRTPVVVSHLNSTLNGEIIDISVRSVAMSVRYGKLIESIDDKEVVLTFTLPTSSNLDGYIKLNVIGKVVFVMCAEDRCKLVCDLNNDDFNENVLMEYVYNRQREIIVEVKKMAKWV